MAEVSTNDANTTIHMEDFILVWLDSAIENKTEYFSQRNNQLRTLINDIQTFTDKDQCLQYIDAIHDEQIFLIVSGSIGQIVVPIIHDLPQLSQIYVFCADKNKHEQWSSSFKKVYDVFNDDESLMVRLKKDLKMHSDALLPISISDTNDRSLQDIDEEQAQFLWCQLLIEVIARLPQTLMSKKELIETCRSGYADNPVVLNRINEFYETYTADTAIHWYTQDSFLYRLFNKAFRTQNIDNIFNYRYFLKDLLQELAKMHLKQFNDQTGTLTVYRGQKIHIKELERIQNGIGHLISINTFFSTTKHCPTAAQFSGDGADRHRGLESVVFEIEIDLSIRRSPFAYISKSSAMKHEEEFLFSMGSIFRIENVELMTDTIWFIQLKHSNDVKIELDNLLSHFKEQIGPYPSILELGVLLSHIGDFERAKRFYLRLLSELPPDHYDLGVVYNNLGEIYRKENNFDIALKYYRAALVEMTDTIGYDHSWCGVVHSNMGAIYCSCSQPDQALRHYQCALFIIQRSDDFENLLYSTICTGMGQAFFLKNDRNAALKVYKKALDIELKMLPSNHPSLVNTYANIGLLYIQIESYAEALFYLQKAIEIQETILPSSHPDLVSLYTVIGVIYSKQSQTVEATTCLKKVNEILDQWTLLPDHPLREHICTMIAKIPRTNELRKFRVGASYRILEALKARKLPDEYEIIKWTTQLGKVFCEQDYGKAFEYHQLALDRVQQLPKTEETKNLHLEIITNLLPLEKYEIFLDHALRLLDEESDPKSLFAAKIHNNLGVYYNRIDNEEPALKHYSQALNIFEERSSLSTKIDIAIAHNNVGNMYLALGNYELAKQHLYRCLDILPDKERELRSEFFWSLGLLYKQTNDLINARQYFQKAFDNVQRVCRYDDPILVKYSSSLQKIDALLHEQIINN